MCIVSLHKKIKQLKKCVVVLFCMIFAISGLYTESSQNESFSSYKQETPTASIQWTVPQLLERPDACTGEQIGTYDAQTILIVGARLERSVRVPILFFFGFYVSPLLFRQDIRWYFQSGSRLPLCQSRHYIICYIHKKDGEKDLLS